jgi:hypothetical protein
MGEWADKYRIRGLDITDEEKAENEAKFKAWYEDFRKQWAEVKQNG